MTTPFFFPPLFYECIVVYMSLQIWRATIAKEKRDQRRDTQRRRAHQRSASSFREKTAFLRRRERGGGRAGGRVDAERLERDVVFAKFTSKGRGTPVG